MGKQSALDGPSIIPQAVFFFFFSFFFFLHPGPLSLESCLVRTNSGRQSSLTLMAVAA